MTVEKCLEIIEKLKDFKAKFYTINVYDTYNGRYYGDCEVLTVTSSGAYVINNNMITDAGGVVKIVYTFNVNGSYTRKTYNYGSLTSILSRLDAIEQKLNQITGTE